MALSLGGIETGKEHYIVNDYAAYQSIAKITEESTSMGEGEKGRRGSIGTNPFILLARQLAHKSLHLQPQKCRMDFDQSQPGARTIFSISSG
jgi:hypothetical protein